MSYAFDVELTKESLKITLVESGEGAVVALWGEHPLTPLLRQMNRLIKRHQRVHYVPEWPEMDTRIDIIGSNGNCGDHYDKI